MRFLYYDRIIRIQKGRDISGIKSFSLSEEFLRGHYRNVAIVPGTIMIEAMAQILGWLVIYSHDFTLSAIMTLIEDVTVTADLRPGFSAEISGELISTSKRDSLGRVKMFAYGREIAAINRIIYSHVHNVDKDRLIRLFTYYSGSHPREFAP